MAPGASGKLRQAKPSPRKTTADPLTRLPALCHPKGDTWVAFCPKEGHQLRHWQPCSQGITGLPSGAAGSLRDGEFTMRGWHKAPGSQISSSDTRLGPAGYLGMAGTAVCNNYVNEI